MSSVNWLAELPIDRSWSDKLQCIMVFLNRQKSSCESTKQQLYFNVFLINYSK